MKTSRDSLDSRVRKLFDEHFPTGKVVSTENVDEEKAETMTLMLEHYRNVFIKQTTNLVSTEIIAELERLLERAVKTNAKRNEWATPNHIIQARINHYKAKETQL